MTQENSQRGFLAQEHKREVPAPTQPQAQQQQETGISVEQVAEAIRLSTGGALPRIEADILARQVSAAKAMIEEYAPAAGQIVKDESTVVMVGYLYDASPVNRNPVHAFANSGARAMLAQWRQPVTRSV